MLFFTFQFPMAFAGPAEVAREALDHQAIWFDSASGALTILATSRDTVSKGQLATSILLGYCDSVIGDSHVMDRVKKVNVINSSRTHGFVFFGGIDTCDEISGEEYLDDKEIAEIILSHSVVWTGKNF
ncbi:hypothetical protein [Aeromonas phage vB_AsaM_LPM4]|uniref:Uncharacterized protein n=1 Tax=Aeromonas phage vB_AsaM_LPM4 TaxID=2894367 RepID=A0AAE9C896_9CAUD|nr:hypothetical protein PQA71_gp53 [Aeromonas phage vB_AsaM_LPM4]UGC97310.1 hypothetical protein [Aeromonas phage vB_AsaM_LPM4]